MNKEDHSRYFRMAFSVSLVLYGFEDGKLKIFLQKIEKNPYQGAWSLPGKMIEPEESLEKASEEIITEAIGNKEIYLEQLNAFGKLYRHPLGRVIDVAFYGLLNIQDDIKQYPKDKEYMWVDANEVPDLAFDHNEIIAFSAHRLKRRLINRPIGFKLLPKQFTLSDLQLLYEAIIGRTLDKRNFRKKLKKLDILEAEGHEETDTPGRKPRLYKFNEDRYQNYMEMGF